MSMGSVTKPIILNETGEKIVEAIDKVAQAIAAGGNTGSGNTNGNTSGGLPSGEESHQMLVTDANAETVWEERTHYKAKNTISFAYDEENEHNIKNEGGEDALYYVSESNIWPGDYDEIYIEFVNWYNETCIAYPKQTVVGDNLILGRQNENYFGEDMYVINSIEEDTVTINGLTFAQPGIYAPKKMVFDNGYDPQDVELKEIICANYHLLDRRFLPRDAVLPDGSGEPHQILVTDGEGDAKWDERTHWKDEGLMDVLPETYAELDADAGSFVLFEPFSMEMELGKTYIVTYNGETYTCVSQEVDPGEGVSFVAVGNAGIMGGEDTGEPFLLFVLPAEMSNASGGASAMMLVNDGSTEATIQIQYDGVVYHKLDPGYMPFATTYGTVDILPETTLEGEDGQFPIAAPFVGKIVVGETYTVTYDGTDYTCMAFPVQENEDAPVIPTLGNQVAAGGEDTGEPFLISYFPPEIVSDAGAYGFVMHMSGLITSVTVRVQGVGGDVKINNSALDLDWIPEKHDVGETLLPQIRTHTNLSTTETLKTSDVNVGDTVIVYCDGVRYDCVAFDRNGITCIGNPAVYSYDETPTPNKETFFMMVIEEGAQIYTGVVGADVTPRTISVYKPGNTQKVPNTMPEEFLPVLSSVILMSSDTSSTKRFKITVNDAGTITATEVT